MKNSAPKTLTAPHSKATPKDGLILFLTQVCPIKKVFRCYYHIEGIIRIVQVFLEGFSSIF
jgi:hypothetical protein